MNAARGISTRSSTNWCAGTSSARSSTLRPAICDVAAHVDRVAPGAQTSRARRACVSCVEPHLPLVAPDLEVDVDDVVVGDGDAAQRVADLERLRLVERLVVPDDPDRVRRGAHAEGAGGDEQPRSVQPPGRYALPFSSTETCEIDSPAERDLAVAAEKEPEKRTRCARRRAARRSPRPAPRRWPGRACTTSPGRARERERGERRGEEEELAVGGARARRRSELPAALAAAARGEADRGRRAVARRRSRRTRASRTRARRRAATAGKTWIALLKVSTVSL